ncbi:MAG: TetR/AcrR family transcriptional regulator [Eubacteriales bacterium]
MTELNAKDRILENAVRIFSEKGFHGTSMRDIANASACSLPNLYYHYKSKNELFEEIVVNQFFKVTEMMNKKLDLSARPEDLYFQVLMTRKELKGFEKEVFKMALKVWLGFEGEKNVREHITDWEKKRVHANRIFIDKSVTDENIRENLTEILVNYMENVINRIILLDEDIDDEKLKKQIALIFQIGR